MNLYKVSVTVELVVAAESEELARSIGYDSVHEEMGNMPDLSIDAKPINGHDDLPYGWRSDSNVYHEGDGDLTVFEVMVEPLRDREREANDAFADGEDEFEDNDNKEVR